MIDLSWALLWIVLALVCFAVAAFGRVSVWRVGLVPAGLAFLTLYFIASGGVLQVHVGG